MTRFYVIRTDPCGTKASQGERTRLGYSLRAGHTAREAGLLRVSQPGSADQGHTFQPALQVLCTHVVVRHVVV